MPLFVSDRKSAFDTQRNLICTDYLLPEKFQRPNAQIEHITRLPITAIRSFAVSRTSSLLARYMIWRLVKSSPNAACYIGCLEDDYADTIFGVAILHAMEDARRSSSFIPNTNMSVQAERSWRVAHLDRKASHPRLNKVSFLLLLLVWFSEHNIANINWRSRRPHRTTAQATFLKWIIIAATAKEK